MHQLAVCGGWQHSEEHRVHFFEVICLTYQRRLPIRVKPPTPVEPEIGPPARKVQVGRLRKAKADTSNCAQEDCKKAGEERMLPKHLCARKLQEANAAKSDRVREDCENKCCQERPCKTVKSESCQGQLRAMR